MSFSFPETLAAPRLPVSSLGAVARVLDVLGAAAVLVFFAPLMICVTAAIFVESGRPIFFSQVRLGRRGRHFRMHKFRKFHEGECSAVHSLTMEDDPRLTRVGGFLRWTKLDELPQLWNVLKGDMSIVGPRPESLDFQDCFEGPYGLVLEHKPGIFGPSQVLFRNECSLYRGRADPEQFYRDVLFPLKARIDLAYFARRTLLRDIAWAIRGALAVFGWSSLLHEGAALVGEVEDWIREGPVGPRRPPAQIGLVTGGLVTGVGLRGVVEIIREGGNEIVASGGLLAAAAGSRRFGAHQALRSESATAPST
jgi:lipopolysaccharide/colanic/teichoic acid biosynthesis glycosyltransferase